MFVAGNQMKATKLVLTKPFSSRNT